jgi:predicted dithiol-disulfide oxidoreductase (DUF899 family)
MSVHFPNESTEYRAARDHLLSREIELRRLAESIAAERRALPPGGLVPIDYEFVELADSTAKKVRMSELFGRHPTLAIYSYMFGPERKDPCMMCTPLLDGIDGAGAHIAQRLSLVVVAESPIERLAAWKQDRGWRNLRLLSAAGTTYNRDYHGKEDGHDNTMLNVFRKLDGKVVHSWGSEIHYAPKDPGQDHRGLDLLNPTFQMLDLTPEGRDDWYPKLRY